MQPSEPEQDVNADETRTTIGPRQGPCRGVALGPLWLLGLMPAFVALFVCFHYGFEAPYMDQWELVPLIEKAFNGDIAFRDLWAQHNVHRIPIPKLIMLVLARLSHWDTRWERAASMTFAFSAAALLMLLFIRAQRRSRAAPWAWLVMSTLFFSAAQWENLLWGWHLLIYLNLLGALLVCAGVSSTNAPRMCVAVAAVGAVLSVFSYGNGLVLLPVGVAILVLQQWQRKRMELASLLAWGIASSLIGLAYVWDFHKPSYDPSYASVVTTPAQYAYYVAAYLGAPLASFDPRPAAVMGIAGFCAYLLLSWKAFRKQDATQRAVLPFDGLALYAIGTAFLTATARTGFGVVQALSTRYIAYSSLLWIAIAVHFCTMLSAQEASRSVRRFLAVVLLLIGFAAAANSALGIYRCDERHDGHVAARDALVSGGPPELLRRLYPDEQVVLKARETLKEYRLNVFR